MRKRVLSLCMALAMCFSLLPIPAFAEEAESVAAVAYANTAKSATSNDNPLGTETDAGEEEIHDFFSSDVEACEGQWWYVLDDSGRILRTKDIHAHDFYVTDYAVSQILVSRNIVYAAVGNIIRAINPDNRAQENLLTASKPIERFAIRGDELFYLAGGSIYKTTVRSEQSISIVTQAKAIYNFWLEDYNTLSYMIDQNSIYDLRLDTGNVNQRANMQSSLEMEDGKDGEVSLLGVSGLAALKAKFPDRKYWNHAGNPGASNSVNNQDGYTSTPCPVHGVVGTSKQTCNGFQPGDTQLSWQCMGYAEKCGYDITGYNPRNNAHGWNTSTSSSSLDSLKAGDIVRYKNNGHSIYITAVNGDTVTYTDCNSDGHCIIRWDVTIAN